MSNFGAWLTDNYGRVLNEPAFTPMVLSGVIDLSGYSTVLSSPNPALVSTGVPASKKCAVFFRGTHPNNSNAVQNNFCLYSLVNIGGVWHISFKTRPNPIRLYIFSNTMPKIPDYGIYFYVNGEMIYHQNCLPLVMKTFDRRTSPNPTRGKMVAVLPSALDSEYEEPDVWGGQPLEVKQWFAGAGIIFWTAGQYDWGASDLNGGWYGVGEGFQPRFRPYTVNILAYIETSIYDKYYQQALGLI